MTTQILAVDVDYRTDVSGEEYACIAGVIFSDWRAQTESGSVISRVDRIEPYQPGEFYRRELPCILRLIEEHDLKPDVIVIDGFVYLDGQSAPGLGHHLYQHFNEKIPVVGVAKKPFRDISADYAILRGDSTKPLYITAAGIHSDTAMLHVKTMAGKHRLPTLLKKADNLCRHAFRQ